MFYLEKLYFLIPDNVPRNASIPWVVALLMMAFGLPKKQLPGRGARIQGLQIWLVQIT